MKTRNGFVSNSSSTSFIVRASCKNEAEKFGLKLISVREVKAIIEQIHIAGAYFLIQYNFQLQEVNRLNDEDFISAPFDRDLAQDLLIDYAVFDEDL